MLKAQIGYAVAGGKQGGGAEEGMRTLPCPNEHSEASKRESKKRHGNSEGAQAHARQKANGVAHGNHSVCFM